MKWMPIARQFRRLLDDVRRVWPGPGEEGLHLIQVGSTVRLDDAAEPFVRVSTKRQRADEYGIAFCVKCCYCVTTLNIADES